MRVFLQQAPLYCTQQSQCKQTWRHQRLSNPPASHKTRIIVADNNEAATKSTYLWNKWTISPVCPQMAMICGRITIHGHNIARIVAATMQVKKMARHLYVYGIVQRQVTGICKSFARERQSFSDEVTVATKRVARIGEWTHFEAKVWPNGWWKGKTDTWPNVLWKGKQSDRKPSYHKRFEIGWQKSMADYQLITKHSDLKPTHKSGLRSVVPNDKAKRPHSGRKRDRN